MTSMNVKDRSAELSPYPPIPLNEQYSWKKYSEYEQQKTHLWVFESPKFKDIFDNEHEKNQIDYKLALPYYKYEINHGKTERKKISHHSEKDSLNQLLTVFNIEKSNITEESPGFSHDLQDQVQLKSINIINHNQEHLMTVIYAFDDKISYQLYKNKRYKNMKPYKKGELDIFSLFLQQEGCGKVLDGYNNIF